MWDMMCLQRERERTKPDRTDLCSGAHQYHGRCGAQNPQNDSDPGVCQEVLWNLWRQLGSHHENPTPCRAGTFPRKHSRPHAIFALASRKSSPRAFPWGTQLDIGMPPLLSGDRSCKRFYGVEPVQPGSQGALLVGARCDLLWESEGPRTIHLGIRCCCLCARLRIPSATVRHPAAPQQSPKLAKW